MARERRKGETTGSTPITRADGASILMAVATPPLRPRVKRLGSEPFKLLYDIYHMQIMEGDVIRTIRDNTSTSRTTIPRACRAGTRSTRRRS
jgi:hypothetical protein